MTFTERNLPLLVQAASEEQFELTERVLAHRKVSWADLAELLNDMTEAVPPGEAAVASAALAAFLAGAFFAGADLPVYAGATA